MTKPFEIPKALVWKHSCESKTTEVAPESTANRSKNTKRISVRTSTSFGIG